MVDGTRTTLRHRADDVMPRQPERMQLVDGQGRRMESPPRWDNGDEGRRRRGGGGHKGMDVEEIWIHDTPARFPRAHSFCARGFFLDSFICLLFFGSFSKLLVSAFVCGTILHATTTTTPFTQRATNTHPPHLERPVFFLLLRVLMLLMGTADARLVHHVTTPLGRRGGRPRLALFSFTTVFLCVCVCGLVHIYNVR